MIPRELIGAAKVPGGVELRLVRHGDDHLMACDRLKTNAAPHLLIGGYGMGFTLRAALAKLGSNAKLTVAELVPEIIAWARGPMAALTAGCLDDPRVQLLTGDVATAITTAISRYDAILLDVDNGPSGLVRAANDGLYSVNGLARGRLHRAAPERHPRDLVRRP